MAARYKRILTLENKRWSKQSPITLEKGALLEDTKKQKLLLQLKFENIQEKVIAGVYIKIVCTDLLGNVSEEIEHAYLDLNIGKNQTFGSDVPVYLSKSDGRKFDITIMSLIFADREVMNEPIHLVEIPNPSTIDELEVYKDEYISNIHKINKDVSCECMPTVYEEYWICTCNALNYLDKDVCRKCGISRKEVFDNTNIEFLQESYKETTRQKEQQELLKLKQEQEEQRKRKKERLVVLITLGVMAVVLFATSAIVNYRKEQEILRMEEESRLEEEERLRLEEEKKRKEYEGSVMKLFCDIDKRYTIEEIESIYGSDYEKDEFTSKKGRRVKLIYKNIDKTLNDLQGDITFVFLDNTLAKVQWDIDLDGLGYNATDRLSRYIEEFIDKDTINEKHIKYYDNNVRFIFERETEDLPMSK